MLNVYNLYNDVPADGCPIFLTYVMNTGKSLCSDQFQGPISRAQRYCVGINAPSIGTTLKDVAITVFRLQL